MQYKIKGFSLRKAGDGEDGALLVKAFSNSLVLDRQNQQIADRAFSKSTVDYFLGNGVFDYWHDSASFDLSKTERGKMLIGKPTGFSWEEYGGVRMPVTYGRITKNHPIVKEICLVEHLEADNDLFGVSVGGRILNKAEKDGREIIDKIFWDHLAVAPRHRIICPGSRLMLHKADDGRPFASVTFDCLDRFCSDLPHVPEDSEYLHKALLAYQGENGLDVRELTGVGALQTESADDEIKNDRLKFYYLSKAGLISNLEDMRFWFGDRSEAVLDGINNVKEAV